MYKKLRTEYLEALLNWKTMFEVSNEEFKIALKSKNNEQWRKTLGLEMPCDLLDLCEVLNVAQKLLS
jgi:hypothetical protein